MHLFDWVIVVAVISVLVVIALVSKRFMTSVSDFLAGNRSAGRYLLTMAEGAAGVGTINIIANWEQYFQVGFSAMWWGSMLGPLALFITLSGFVVYRYRETRALTMAQFFEIRYSRKFRIFSGMLAWSSGIINYGIFPAVTARCFIYMCGIPIHTVDVLGFDLNLTLAVTMAIMLSVAVVLTLSGGQITVMITDFFQSQWFSIVFIVISVLLLYTVGWERLVETLKQAPEGRPMLNPFKQKGVSDFNMWYYMMQGFLLVYGYRAWQAFQSYNCAAKSPHEARMANILASWRGYAVFLVLAIVPICIYVVMNNADFGAVAGNVHAVLGTFGDEMLQKQMMVPIALREILPIGMLGMLVSALLATAISTDDTYLHAWGSIFIQDVVMPLRKKELAPEQHIKWLRFSVIGVAVFAWFFSMVFPLKEYIFMYFQITGAIYLGGAGAVIIGGLYWKRGTTAGAFSAMAIGSILAVSGIVLNNMAWPALPGLKERHAGWAWLQNLPTEFPLNGMEISFLAALIAVTAYVVVSLLTKPDPEFSMDRMLHRGKYSVDGEHEEVNLEGARGWKSMGIGKEFTRGDKILSFASMFMSLFFWAVFIVGTILYLVFGATDDTWSKWWLFRVVFAITISLVVLVWFLYGGIRNLKELFQTLKTAERNDMDDGRVVGHHSLADEETFDDIK